jgi:hypothetical protein
MKTPVRSIASTLTAILVLAATPARALTNEEIGGVYQGTSTATLPSGEQITAQLTVALRRSGQEKVVATVNGQTTTSIGRYQFVSPDVILSHFPGSESVFFVELKDGKLTANVIAKESNGEIVYETTVLKRVQ